MKNYHIIVCQMYLDLQKVKGFLLPISEVIKIVRCQKQPYNLMG